MMPQSDNNFRANVAGVNPTTYRLMGLQHGVVCRPSPNLLQPDHGPSHVKPARKYFFM